MPASGSQTPSMAFTAPTAARLPLQPTNGGSPMTTLYWASQHRHTLRTGQLFRPASHPASRPRTGASLPGTRTSPRARSTLAGSPQFAWLSRHQDHSFLHGAQADGHTPAFGGAETPRIGGSPPELYGRALCTRQRSMHRRPIRPACLSALRHAWPGERGSEIM